MATNFSRVYEYNFIKRMQELISQSSIIKQEIFKNSIMGNEVNYVKIKSYISFINDFLKFWEDYAKDTQSKMGKVHGVKGIKNIKYQDIKNYIYTNYDYAAIIPFIDNLYEQLEQDTMTKDDVNEYFTVTVSKAFDNQPATVAGLIDSVAGSDSILFDRSFRTEKSEVTLFDSVKNYRKMFPDSDRIMLYKAIQKAVEFATRKNLAVKVGKNNVQTFIAVINWTIEMITYSLVAYASRIYIICCYGYNVIDASPCESNIKDMAESTDMPVLDDNVPYTDIRIMMDSDETIFNNIDKVKEAFDVVNNFITTIGAKGSESLDLTFDNYTACGTALVSNNKFIDKLKETNNMLFTVLDDYRALEVNGNRLKCIEENIQQLKFILYNGKQGNSVMSSPMQEFLHIIRGIGSDDSTMKDCKDTALSLAKTFVYFNNKIRHLSERLNEITKWDLSKQSTSINEEKDINEYRKLLLETYSSTMVPIFQRFRDIEILFNRLSNQSRDKILKDVSLDGATNIVKSVPDTLRMPLNLLDLYALPAFEAFSMYDEYLRSLPQLSDDIYLSEAFNMSDIINKLMSLIKGSWDSLMGWYNNASVKAAMKWIKDNEENIRKMDLTPAVGMKAFPYPSINSNSQNKNLDLEKGYKNLLTNLKNFNPDANNFDLEKFITSLYPNETVQKWFDDKDGKQKYWTWIITNCGENAIKDGNAVQEVVLDEKTIPLLQKECLENCKDLDKLFSGLSRIKNDIDREVNSLKSKAVKVSGDANKTGSDVGNSNTNDNNQNSNQNNDQKDNNIEKQDSAANNMNAALNQINLAVTRLWIPIPKIVSKVITDQYQLIKTAYMASKGNNSENN